MIDSIISYTPRGSSVCFADYITSNEDRTPAFSLSMASGATRREGSIVIPCVIAVIDSAPISLEWSILGKIARVPRVAGRARLREDLLVGRQRVIEEELADE